MVKPRKPPPEDRSHPDRREHPTTLWSALIPGGRRLRNRRASEHFQQYFVDRFPIGTFILIVALLTLSTADAAITLVLLDDGCEEINPLMYHLLTHGTSEFVLGKYILTATGMPLLLIFKNYYLFGTRFRVDYLIPLFVLLYLILIAYQYFLLSSSPIMSHLF